MVVNTYPNRCSRIRNQSKALIAFYSKSIIFIVHDFYIFFLHLGHLYIHRNIIIRNKNSSQFIPTNVAMFGMHIIIIGLFISVLSTVSRNAPIHL